MIPIEEYFSLKKRYKNDKFESVSSFKNYHIMCEGIVTEIKYFEAIKNSVFLNVRNGIKIKILKRTELDEGRTQLLEMHKLMKEYMIEAKLSEDDIPVLVVDFDVHKTNTHFEEDIEKIKNDGISVYGNSPCIEFWYILHIPDSLNLHILPNESSHFSNIRVSRSHTYTSRMASKLLGFNTKKTIKSDMVENLNIALEQSSKVENNIELLNTKIGTNFNILLKELIKDERF